MRNEHIHRRVDEICRQGHKYIWITTAMPEYMLIAFAVGFLAGVSLTRLIWG